MVEMTEGRRLNDTRELAEKIVAYRLTSPSKLAQLEKLFLDYCGVAAAGARTESARIVRQYLVRQGGAPEATALGARQKLPASSAAFINAVSEHSIEMDDVDVLALFHVGAPVISPALALAELTGTSGKSFLEAAAAGIETMCRIGFAANPTLRDRGYHTTATAGVFGGTAAAGRLLGLNGEQMASALGLAGAMAAGLMEMYGPDMQKRFNPGPAAQNAVTAARLAALGYCGAQTVLEGERGFFRAFVGRLPEKGWLDDFGGDAELPIEHKVYACARPIHTAIDAALGLRESVMADEIAAITVVRHPSWASYHQIPSPLTYHDAQMSLPFALALALVKGGAFFSDYSEEALQNPAILRLSRMVQFATEATLPTTISCRVELVLDSGRQVSYQVDRPKGSLDNPASTKEIADKFRNLMGPDYQSAEALIALARDIGNAKNVNALMERLALL